MSGEHKRYAYSERERIILTLYAAVGISLTNVATAAVCAFWTFAVAQIGDAGSLNLAIGFVFRVIAILIWVAGLFLLRRYTRRLMRSGKLKFGESTAIVPDIYERPNSRFRNGFGWAAIFATTVLGPLIPPVIISDFLELANAARWGLLLSWFLGNLIAFVIIVQPIRALSDDPRPEWWMRWWLNRNPEKYVYSERTRALLTAYVVLAMAAANVVFALAYAFARSVFEGWNMHWALESLAMLPALVVCFFAWLFSLRALLNPLMRHLGLAKTRLFEPRGKPSLGANLGDSLLASVLVISGVILVAVHKLSGLETQSGLILFMIATSASIANFHAPLAAIWARANDMPQAE